MKYIPPMAIALGFTWFFNKYSLVPNFVYCEFYETSTHSMEKYKDMDALANILYNNYFRILDNLYTQGRGQGRGKGGRWYRGGGG